MSLLKIMTAILVVVLLLCCNSIDLNPFVSSEVKKGHQLALTYCGSCHRFPEPGLLDKKTWEAFVLPKMGSFLGLMRFPTGGYIGSGKESIRLDEWKKIVQYYIAQSPKELPLSGSSKIHPQTGMFTAVLPVFTLKKPATTLVSFDTSSRRFFWGDGMTGEIFDLLTQHSLNGSLPSNRGVVHLRRTGSSFQLLTMGLLHPSDEKAGKLDLFNPEKRTVCTLLDSLQRPVHASYADLNGDGREDIVVCEFGNLSGALGWFEKGDSGHYVKHILRPLPGAVCTQIDDFNHDGRPDIMALMAQGDEGLFIYYNQGNGRFREQRLLRFPPSYGFNYFELADFDRDGHPDILATNGDNGDYPPILKPYHGIRIYRNNGNNGFSEAVFLPMHGAGKAVARDFDGDGDLDLASISYFPDYDHTPEEGFLYWENKGDDRFEPSSIKEATLGRWLTMDAGDIDGDGDTDIVLGNSFFSLGYIPGRFVKAWERYTPSVLILKNNRH